MIDYNPYSLRGNVIITGRNAERLQETLCMMDHQQEHSMVIADLSSVQGVFTLADAVDNTIDGLVLCAGFTIVKPFKYVSEKDIYDIMDVNYKAPVLLAQRLLKKKKISKGASIVFISSVSGVFISAPAGALYSGSKGAVNGIAKAMAIDLSSRGVRVNCVNPGMVDTNIFAKGDITKEQLEEDVKNYPLGRYGKPEDIAYAVIYLLSDASNWVTGTNLKIDGGLTLL